MEKNIRPLFYLSVEELSSLIKTAVTDALDNKHQQKSAETKELLTIKEAAEFLRLSVATLYTMNCRNRIPMTKVSGKVYYRRSALMLWLDSGERKTTAQLRNEIKEGKKNE